ncbi:MAG: JAB domain-containing protein [Steroidobacteraceae bacterium]
MSNHNLFIHHADGTVVLASNQEILTAARVVLGHRVRRGAVLQSPQKVGEYLTMRVGHLDYECFGVILLDQRHRIIDCVELFRGTIDGAAVYPREIIKLVLDKQAGAVVVYHNHPSGVKEPSRADELITARLRESLAAIDVRLIDHLVIAASSVLSFAQQGLL